MQTPGAPFTDRGAGTATTGNDQRTRRENRPARPAAIYFKRAIRNRHNRRTPKSSEATAHVWPGAHQTTTAQTRPRHLSGPPKREPNHRDYLVSCLSPTAGTGTPAPGRPITGPPRLLKRKRDPHGRLDGEPDQSRRDYRHNEIIPHCALPSVSAIRHWTLKAIHRRDRHS